MIDATNCAIAPRVSYGVNGMESDVADILHCEEQLRTSLQGDDKEKLRRKLAVLQREYLRTVQRLKRAERSEAVQRHVRSRITQQNHLDQRDPELTSNPSSPMLDTTNGTASGTPQCQGDAGDSDTRRPQVIRFSLPSGDRQTTDPCFDAARGHRPNPALRLRSRRSRLSWERRSTEAGVSTDISDEGREQSERTETRSTQGSEGRIKNEDTEVVNESEELFSGTESESPSLLLTHWKTGGNTNTSCVEGKGIQAGQEQSEKETDLRSEGKKETRSASLLLTCGSPAIQTEGRGQDGTQSRGGEGGEAESNTRQRDGRLCEDDRSKNAEQIESKSYDDTVEMKEEKSGLVAGERDEKGAGLLESCTLVEGLLFPAEYYVRTTRRMTSSRSQPDMHAVILSQLSIGRRRRCRGRGRAPEAAGTSAEPNSQSSSEISDRISACQTEAEARFPPAVAAARPSRGRRKRRGRGRGRTQMPRCSLDLDAHHLGLGQTSDDPQPTSSSVSSSPSLRGTHGPKPRLTSGGAIPAPGDAEPASSQSGCASGHQAYPIFLRSSRRTNRSTQMNTSATFCRSLLLPSSPPAQTSLPPLSFLSFTPPLRNVDILKDFHLPDDQFASLKLDKLSRVAMESRVELFASPYLNTRRSARRRERCHDPVTSLPLPLSPTPTISSSPSTTGANQGSSLTGKPTSQPLTEASATRGNPAERQTGSPHPVSASAAHDCAERDEDENAVVLNSHSQINVSSNNRHGSIERSFQPQRHIDLAEEEEKEDQTGLVPPEDHRSAGDKAPEETFSACTPAQACNSSDGPAEAAVQPRSEKSPARESQGSPERTTSVPREQSVDSQFLLSPLASGPLLSPHLRSSALPSIPALLTVGLTPHPLTSSPSAPTLLPPPPHSPTTQDLSPPVLSPCPSLTPLPPEQTPVSPAGQTRASCEPSQRVGPAACPTISGVQSLGSGWQADPDEGVMRCTTTLKAPAGGFLVDACCLPGSSGGVYVAAAGKWAVCLWSQTSASDWSLIHTWTFKKPVISVFPVPDAAGLMCVTLGQLEIREARLLSCSGLFQVLFYEGLVQAVVGVAKSRVVTSSHSASGSTLQVFTLSDSGSTPSSRPLASPGVCVGALAPVDGLPDALLGTDEGGRLFVWNLRTGQLLQRITLGDGLSHTACLRGFSHCGALFVLLQHQLLGSPGEEEENEARDKVELFSEGEKSEERKKTALLSLVAINPLNGKSVPVTRLYPPASWSGRLCEAEASGCSVVGLSQSGCVCVWELGRRGASRTVRAPESEGWQLARWGGGDTLLTGHHNGDVTLHCYSNG